MAAGKNGGVDLIKVFRHSVNGDKLLHAFDAIAKYTSDGVGDPGWFVRKHFKGPLNGSISEDEVHLYVRSLLAATCRKDPSLEPILRRACLSSNNPKDLFAVDTLKSLFPAFMEGNIIVQQIKTDAVDIMARSLRDPVVFFSLLEENESAVPGWMPSNWFFNNRKKLAVKLTRLEEIVFRVQVLIMTGHEAMATAGLPEDTPRLRLLKHAWGTKFKTDHKSTRDLEVFFRKHFKDSIIPSKKVTIQRQHPPRRTHNQRQHQPRRSLNDSDYAGSDVDGAGRQTPVRTRGNQVIAALMLPFGTPMHGDRHRTQHTPISPPSDDEESSKLATVRSQKIRIRATMSTAKKIAAGIFKRPNLRRTPTAAMKSPASKTTPNRTTVRGQVVDLSETSVSQAESITLTPFRPTGNDSLGLLESNNSGFVFGIDYSSSESSNSATFGWGNSNRLFVETNGGDSANTAAPHQSPQRAPRAAKTKQFVYDEVEHDDKVEAGINAEEKEEEAVVILSRGEDACAIMDSVLHLAAVGSSTTRTTMKAILVNSVGDKVTDHLVESGYAEKRRQTVMQNNMKINATRQRGATRRGVEPVLIDVEPKMKFIRPMQNRNQQAQSRRDWNEHLLLGKDIPVLRKATYIKAEKVDRLIAWVVDTCQFRPGRMRNFRFKAEGVTLKNLPVYMRYGTYGSCYKKYSTAVPSELRVGFVCFRDILKATTVKGTYNQGLSYFYVDFIDMTKLVLGMLERLESLVEEQAARDSTELERAVNKNDFQRDYLTAKDIEEGGICAIHLEALEWLEKAKANTESSRDYLTHQFYADITKDGDDVWTNASNALGHEEPDRELEANQKSPVFLALTNHLFLIHAVDLVKKSLEPDTQEDLKEEFDSMIELATLSGLETRHYANHCVRGWWQDKAINELKRLLISRKHLKGVVADHKNKLVPRSKNEAMSAYFSKAGISILGAMIFWCGSRMYGSEKVDGIFVWFVDMIMNNTTAQDARDLMPGIETIRSEMSEPYFEEMAGPTKAFFLLSDNALISSSHSAFVSAFNEQAVADSSSGSGASRDTANTDSNDESATTDEPAGPTSDAGSFADNSDESSSGADPAELFENAMQMEAVFGNQVSDDRFQTVMQQCIDSPIIMGPQRIAVLVKWITWEAQKGKSQLDTHFAYLNKQLAAACLEGDIDYLDPGQVFEALSYQGGSSASTTILLDELTAAQELFTACDKAISGNDRKGIKAVHDFSFGETEVTLRNFSNLDTGKKTLQPNDWPTHSSDKPLGDVLKRHVNTGEPVFFPFKETICTPDDPNSKQDSMDLGLLSTRVYKSLIKHSSGMDIAHNEISEHQTARRELQRNREAERATDLEHLMGLDSVKAYLEVDASEYDSLPSNWAKKKNRSHMSLSKEVQAALSAMFSSGQGTTSKGVRYTAERAVMELHNGLLKFRWGQRLITNVTKVKSFFSRKFTAEQKGNDEGLIVEEAQATRLERGRTLLSNNDECEQRIVKAMDQLGASIQNATVEHFFKAKVALLKAFVHCRSLDDACSRGVKLPNKGTLAQARSGETFLVRLAYDLRASAVTAKLVEKQLDGADLDAEIFEMEPEETTEDILFDNLAHEVTVEGTSDVEEIVDGQIDEIVVDDELEQQP